MQKKLTASDVMNLINHLENEFPVTQWTVCGVEMWPLLRVRIYIEIFEDSYNKDAEAVPATLFGKLIERIKPILSSIFPYLKWYFSNINNEKVMLSKASVVFLSDGSPLIKSNGEMIDRFCTPLVDRLRKQTHDSIIISPSHVEENVRSPTLYIKPWLGLLNLIGHAKSLIGNNDLSLPQYKEVTTYLAERKITLNALNPSKIRSDAYRLNAIKSYYLKLLSLSPARLAFIVSYYSLEGMAFITACHEKEIKVIDIQHGVQCSSHVGYGNWHSVPDAGYDLLPDYFWVWSKFECDMINTWRNESTIKHLPINGGNVYLADCLGRAKDGPNTNRQIIKSIKEKSNAAYHALITEQFMIDPSRLVDPFWLFVKEAPKNWHWWFRLHPNSMEQLPVYQNKIKQLDCTNVTLYEANSLPLYEILPEMDIHITDFSSTIIEAYSFGVHSICMASETIHYFPNVYEAGYLHQKTFFDNNFIETIEQLQKTETKEPHNNVPYAERALSFLLKHE